MLVVVSWILHDVTGSTISVLEKSESDRRWVYWNLIPPRKKKRQREETVVPKRRES